MSTRHLIRIFPLILAMLTMAARLRAQTGLPGGFDDQVQEVLTRFQVPGMSISIVKEGKVLLARGYGARQLGKPERVDEKTLFPIASNSKAFTAAALEILVESGKLKWEDPVIHYLPWFNLSDPWVTAQITVRDLLVHHSGIGAYAADILNFPPTDYTRREILEKVRLLPLVHSFRTTYAYDNILYLAAGEIIRVASGMEWEDFIRTRILQPLAMTSSLSRFSTLPNEPNRASGHGLLEGKLALYEDALRQDIGDAGNPAGGIASNATDMTRWLMAQLDSGKTRKGSRLWSAKGTMELWNVVTPVPLGKLPESLAPAQNNFAGYALGLRIYDYGGYKVVGHGGKLDGFVSQVVMVPDLRLGITVMTNQESTGAYWTIIHTLLDHFMQRRPFDWQRGYLAAQDSSLARMARERKKNLDRLPAAHKAPSLALQDYAGVYRDSLYGDIRVRWQENHLALKFTHSDQLEATLEPANLDVFKAHFHNKSLKADAWAIFTIGPEGKPTTLTLEVIDPDSDISFSGLNFNSTH